MTAFASENLSKPKAWEVSRSKKRSSLLKVLRCKLACIFVEGRRPKPIYPLFVQNIEQNERKQERQKNNVVNFAACPSIYHNRKF
jgi:hypothetical protein